MCIDFLFGPVKCNVPFVPSPINSHCLLITCLLITLFDNALMQPPPPTIKKKNSSPISAIFLKLTIFETKHLFHEGSWEGTQNRPGGTAQLCFFGLTAQPSTQLHRTNVFYSMKVLQHSKKKKGRRGENGPCPFFSATGTKNKTLGWIFLFSCSAGNFIRIGPGMDARSGFKQSESTKVSAQIFIKGQHEAIVMEWCWPRVWKPEGKRSDWSQQLYGGSTNIMILII